MITVVGKGLCAQCHKGVAQILEMYIRHLNLFIRAQECSFCDLKEESHA